MNRYVGGSATFTTALAGGTPPITLRWQKRIAGVFTNLSEGGALSGTGTGILTVNPVGLTDDGEYRLTASNTAGTENSNSAVLTVLSTLPDVTSPGDLITLTSGRTPDGEAAANAFDNVGQKYLNFGLSPEPPFVGPAALTVVPLVGATQVTGLRFYTANDVVARDPIDYSLEGSNDAGATYTVIAAGPLDLPDGRNLGGAEPLDPEARFLRQYLFPNPSKYTSYRISFSRVKDNMLSNIMQLAEIELLGTYQPALTITAEAAGTIQIRTNRLGMLQTSTSMQGMAPVWTDVQLIEPSTPYEFTPAVGEPRRFYRAVTQ